jgi:choice-of-anchor B domain-containing protein
MSQPSRPASVRPSASLGGSNLRVRPRALLAAAALGCLLALAPARALATHEPCVDGFAGPYPCQDVDMMAHMPLGEIGGGSGSDIWGWTDPMTGKEYALMGRSTGTSFIDITDPENPVYLGDLPTHTFPSAWRDIKVYADHAYIVADNAGQHGLQVFHLPMLRDVANPPVTFAEMAHYEGFTSAHNIVIDEETGFACAVGITNCGEGLHMMDLSNPHMPMFLGCFSADGYTHDAQCVVYHGPDEAYQGKEICFAYNEDTLTIVDVSDPASPAMIARMSYSGVGYTHQGWLTTPICCWTTSWTRFSSAATRAPGFGTFQTWTAPR